MDKTILIQNLKIFCKHYFNDDIDKSSLEYITSDLDPHMVATAMIEYVENVGGCSECMMDIIVDFITETIEGNDYAKLI